MGRGAFRRDREVVGCGGRMLKEKRLGGWRGNKMWKEVH